jgi:phosphohistidine phosphatase
MILYLVQHAEAKREEEDPSRPLSERGLRDINRVASYVSKLDIKTDKIFHSTKLRAKQTAEILFEYLKTGKGVSETDGLSPLDSPDIWAERLKDISVDVILIGHLPHLGRLASLLLCGNAEINALSFKMAGIVCLEREETGTWSLRWMLTPEIVVGEKDMGPCDGL